MKEINIYNIVGDFAEDKDKAKLLRTKSIKNALKKHDLVILNFGGVEIATQSFIHALISQIMRTRGVDVLDKIHFKNCNDAVKTIIKVVVEYMQEVV